MPESKAPTRVPQRSDMLFSAAPLETTTPKAVKVKKELSLNLAHVAQQSGIELSTESDTGRLMLATASFNDSFT